MQRRTFLRTAALAVTAPALTHISHGAGQGATRPNLLIITVDDMNCDSVGVYGCKLKDTTPHMDALASQGVRFEHAHTQVANCMPCRNVMQSGRFSHTNGVEGFYQVKPARVPVLPDLLKAAGYFNAIKGKVSHSTPYHPYPAWDLVEDRPEKHGAAKSAEGFKRFTQRAIEASRAEGKPFYLLINITDPHKPFYGSEKSKRAGYDGFPPSRTFNTADIPIPGFLPENPEVRAELKMYYDSVRRADDLTGATLQALKDAGEDTSTLVMFMSDHGMPFPFAKTSLYHHSTHTPWLARWPGKVKPGTVDRTHMISTVDFVPTILEAVGIPLPEGLQGRSYLPVLLGQTQAGRDWVIKEYNENAGGGRHPMRGVQTRRYGYLFNPWANGTRKFKTATTGTQTYRVMQRLAETDEAAAERLRIFDHRDVEEFFDYANDPDALHNLIASPEHQDEITRLRKILDRWMEQTSDPCLEAFRQRDDPDALDAYVNKLQEESDMRRRERRKTKKPGRSKRTGLIRLQSPGTLARGADIQVRITHTIPKSLGSQLLHVTAKQGSGARIDRKVVTVSGNGDAVVTFRVPPEATYSTVSFAAFIGKDYPGCLQHVATAQQKLH